MTLARPLACPLCLKLWPTAPYRRTFTRWFCSPKRYSTSIMQHRFTVSPNVECHRELTHVNTLPRSSCLGRFGAIDMGFWVLSDVGPCVTKCQLASLQGAGNCLAIRQRNTCAKAFQTQRSRRHRGQASRIPMRICCLHGYSLRQASRAEKVTASSRGDSSVSCKAKSTALRITASGTRFQTCFGLGE